MGNSRYRVDGDLRRSGPGSGVAMHTDKLKKPMRWRTPSVVFVNSVNDLSHDAVTSVMWVALDPAEGAIGTRRSLGPIPSSGRRSRVGVPGMA
jgi:hypothetical protein